MSSIAPNSSSVSRAVENTLSLFRDEGEVGRGETEELSLCHIFSYREDFDYLWGIEEQEPENPFFLPERQDTFDREIVVIWDEIPSGTEDNPVRTSKYLTPLDWAVAASLSLDDAFQRGDIAQRPGLRLHILDLASQHFENADSVRFFQQFPKQTVRSLRWVRFYRPTGGEDTWGFSDLLASAISSGTDSEKAVPSMRACFEEGTEPDLQMVRRYWSSIFAKPSTSGDRHAISNLMGPLLLMQDRDPGRHILALRQLMRSIDLIPDAAGQEPSLLTPQNSWVNWKDDPWSDKLRRLEEELECEGITLSLIDDQAFEQGWGKVLCRAAGVQYEPPEKVSRKQRILIGEESTPAITIEASLRGEWLLPQLDGKDRRFELQIAGDESASDEPRAEILFLDLRLFSGEDLEREKQFIRDLLNRARKFEVDAQDDPSTRQATETPAQSELPWPGFEKGELDEIKAWLDGGKREESAYHKALTLLPRLIALTDLSLPIVLFSSTGRREITEALKPYGNIITRFDKPRFFGATGSNIASEIAEKFKAAFSRALDLAAARMLCAKLPSPASQGDPGTDDEIQRGDTEGLWEVELMLDEAGEVGSRFSVGGIVAAFPPDKSLDDIEDTLKKEHSSLRYDKGYGRKNAGQIAEAVIESTEEEGIEVAAVSITAKRGVGDSIYTDVERDSELHDERVADNLHRELVRCLIETSIYLWARHHIPAGAQISFNVRGATRHVPLLEKDSRRRRQKELLRDKWGIRPVWVGKEATIWKAKRQIDKAVDLLPSRHQNHVEHIQEQLDSLCANLQKPTQLIRYFGFDDVRPLVEEVMHEYRGSKFEPTPDVVRAFRLNSNAAHIPLLHFYADAIISSNRSKPNVKKLWKRGFVGTYGPELKTLLESHRQILGSLPDQGIAKSGQAAVKLEEYDPLDIKMHLSKEVGEASQKISGDEFTKIEKLFSEEGNKFSDKKLNGKIILKESKYAFIEDGYGRTFYAEEGDFDDFSNISEGDDVIFEGRRQRTPGRYKAVHVKIK